MSYSGRDKAKYDKADWSCSLGVPIAFRYEKFRA